MTEFIFATAQYDSGDWDSAPTLPANIIDTIARYTEIDIAPTGAVVPLADDRMLRFPFLYLTGHLPVRFSDVAVTPSSCSPCLTRCACCAGRMLWGSIASLRTASL